MAHAKEDVMTWIIGIDLQRNGSGALRFANWLAQRRRDTDGERFVGVHVLEPDHLRSELRFRHLDEVVEGAARAAGEVLEREGASERVREVLVVEGARADDGLVEVCDRWNARAVIIGRMAERQSHRLVRLGPVARRMVGGAPVPVIVVPPDMREEDFGDGAVVALCDFSEESAEACRFAGRIAAQLGRPLHVALVASPHHPKLTAVVPSQGRSEPPPSGALEARRLNGWLASRNLHVDTTSVLETGDPAEELSALAARERAPLLAVAAKQLQGLDRLLEEDAARTLAGWARCPVAVVPARPQEDRSWLASGGAMD